MQASDSMRASCWRSNRRFSRRWLARTISAAIGSVTSTQNASIQLKNASSTQIATVETHPATSCGTVLESIVSCAVTSLMMRSATSAVPRRLKKLMGSRRRCSARDRRIDSDSV